MLTGSLLQIAEVFKQLVRHQTEKPLSFREKKMLDRARTMLIGKSRRRAASWEIGIDRSADKGAQASPATGSPKLPE